MDFFKTCVTLIKEQLNVIKNELQLLLLESESAKNSDTATIMLDFKIH
ncbi:unnamed protein product [Oikopleura dioica]|uniref:Uncharacterized protein n=1 Tax=Oikopleura dioica TaxID=34765 RepID=E4WVT4_OIKDI|nr:unnamed protein product [Oikopleura dioica]